MPDLVLRGTPEPNKPVAQKGDVEFLIDQGNKTMGVAGRDLQKTIDSFKELSSLSIERLDLSPDVVTDYVELNGDGWAKTDQSPVSSFSSFWSNCKLFPELAKVVGDNVVNFGVELAPPDKNPNDPEWFYIILQPLFASATRRYHFQYLKRGANTDKMFDAFAKADDTLKRLIMKIESK
ncbi:MAG: hypothetical protein HY529_06510 [Chloroflexi bacterium]|nr:hypothetical protein [Chloroflexota bacterium]